MEKADKLAQELAPVAGEVLEVFGQISEAVKKESTMLARVPVDVFANTANSTFTSPPSAAARLVAGRYELQRDAEQLRREPAIARVSCHDGEKECVTYICRGAPPSVPGFDLVSQRAPRGRLAALAVGDSLTLPTGRTLEVLERLEVHPEQISGGWDSKNNILRLPSKRPITIESLRALLGTATVIVQDLLAQLVAEENKKHENFSFRPVAGMKKSARTMLSATRRIDGNQERSNCTAASAQHSPRVNIKFSML